MIQLVLVHANPGFKTRFECKSRCKSTADAEIQHPHSKTRTRFQPTSATDDNAGALDAGLGRNVCGRMTTFRMLMK